MPKFLVEREQPPSLDEFLARVARITSKRKVRPVVTRSGHRARGPYAAYKTEKARYESLVEFSALRVLEVASDVRTYRTHPMVLALWSGDHVMHYTPDMLVHHADSGFLLEVKATYFLTQPKVRTSLSEQIRRLRRRRLELALVVESDLNVAGLQDELAYLTHMRPLVGRYRPALDMSAFDPLGRSIVSAATQRRWHDAQKECNELLARVMRRDPDDLISAACR